MSVSHFDCRAMVGGRRRGRIVDAEENSDEKPRKKQQQKATTAAAARSSGEVGLGVMDPGPGDALVSLTASSDRRPPNRINKQALASRYARQLSQRPALK